MLAIAPTALRNMHPGETVRDEVASKVQGRQRGGGLKMPPTSGVNDSDLIIARNTL